MPVHPTGHTAETCWCKQLVLWSRAPRPRVLSEQLDNMRSCLLGLNCCCNAYRQGIPSIRSEACWNCASKRHWLLSSQTSDQAFITNLFPTCHQCKANDVENCMATIDGRGMLFSIRHPVQDFGPHQMYWDLKQFLYNNMARLRS